MEISEKPAAMQNEIPVSFQFNGCFRFPSELRPHAIKSDLETFHLVRSRESNFANRYILGILLLALVFGLTRHTQTIFANDSG